MLISTKISSVEKNYKYFISYMMMILKLNNYKYEICKDTSYVKSYGGETKCMYFY